MEFTLVFDYVPDLQKINKNIFFINRKISSLYSEEEKKYLNIKIVKNFKYISDKDKIEFVNDLEQKLFPFLIDLINSNNNLNLDYRSGKIIFGHWFRKKLRYIYNKYYILNNLLNQHQIKECIFLNSNIDLPLVKFSNETSLLFNDIKYNNFLYSIILEYLNFKNIKYLKYDFLKKNNKFDKIKKKQNTINSLIKYILEIVFSVKSQKKYKYFISSSYLSYYNEFLLNLLFFQIPNYQFFKTAKNNSSINYNLRKKIDIQLSTIGKFNKFDKFIMSYLFKTIPISFLEEYKYILNKLNSFNLPKKPEVIFTSNLYEDNDYFKIWTALKVANNAKLFIGQHGNNYFTSILHKNTIEEEVCDKFFIWGKNKSNKKYVNSFIFKNILKNNTRNNNGLLITLEHLKISIECSDPWDEFNKYLDTVSNFLNTLNPKILNETTVRLHSASLKDGFNFKTENFLDKVTKKCRVSYGLSSIHKLFSKNKLILHTYDSTGLLETLISNKPTLVFLINGIDHINQSYRHLYDLLIEVKIIHLSSDSLLNHLNMYWDDLDTWWFDFNTQKNINIFCNNLVCDSNNKVIKLKKLIKNN